MYTMLFGATLFFAVSLYSQTFPYWLAIPAVAALPVGILFKTGKDPRGAVAIDITGNLQNTFWFVINVIVVSWLAVVLL